MKNPRQVVPIFVISSQVLSAHSTKQYVPILIAIFVQYAPKYGTCFTAVVSEWKSKRKDFIKFSLHFSWF